MIAGAQAIPTLTFGVSIFLVETIKKIGSFKIKLIYTIFLTLIFIFLSKSLIFNYSTIYRDQPIPQLSKQFTDNKLQNIYSSSSKVEIVHQLITELKSKLNHDDFLLAYYDLPIIYYLLDIRPSIAVTWARDDHSFEMGKALIEQMIIEKREPKIVIRTQFDLSNLDWLAKNPAIDYAKSPINQFVVANYELYKTIPPFELYARKSKKGLNNK
jgi:hypothetical protein